MKNTMIGQRLRIAFRAASAPFRRGEDGRPAWRVALAEGRDCARWLLGRDDGIATLRIRRVVLSRAFAVALASTVIGASFSGAVAGAGLSLRVGRAEISRTIARDIARNGLHDSLPAYVGRHMTGMIKAAPMGRYALRGAFTGAGGGMVLAMGAMLYAAYRRRDPEAVKPQSS